MMNDDKSLERHEIADSNAFGHDAFNRALRNPVFN